MVSIYVKKLFLEMLVEIVNKLLNMKLVFIPTFIFSKTACIVYR